MLERYSYIIKKQDPERKNTLFFKKKTTTDAFYILKFTYDLPLWLYDKILFLTHFLARLMIKRHSYFQKQV